MTVSVQMPQIEYIEDGVTVNFPVPFRYRNPSHLVAERIAADGTITALANGVDYSADPGDSDAGGTLTVTLPAASGVRLRIGRDTPRQQDNDYITTGAFSSDSHEAALDELAMVDQEQDVKIENTAARAALVPDGEIAPAFPALADRKGKVAAFDPATGEFSLTSFSAVYDGTQAIIAENRVVMAAFIGLANGQSVALGEAGRAGVFTWRTGDHSAEVSGDPQQGIYIAPVWDPTGASGAWRRQFHGALNVKWFGAMGDGSTDESAAIQAACNLANALGDSSQWPGSSTFASVAPAVFFPKGGIYRVNATISIEQHRFVKLISDGRALIVGDTSGTKTTTLFDGTGVRYLEVDGLQFNNINTAFVVSSGNLNSSKYTFQNVICDSTTLFLDTETYALSRSTIVNFDHCVFESDVVQVAQAYVDVINVRDCWIAARSSTTDTFYVNSLINFDGCIFIPAGTTAIGGAWVRLTEDDGEAGTAIEEHRGVHFSGCRFSNEGSNHTIVVNDYGVVNEVDANTPVISFDACSINGFHGSMYESGNSEGGLVYLLQYPGSISFKDCGFFTLGNAEGALVAKSDTLTAAPEDGFLIDVDDLSFSSAMRSVGATTSKLVARSLRSYIRNPDPYTFRDILEDGHLEVVSTATTGQKKATFTIQTGWSDASSRTPITFLLYLGGQGRTGGTTNIQYAGASIYLVTIAGVFVSAAHQSEISFTKLHGGTFGNGNTSNCDIISMHFGTADTGSTLAPLATSHDVTVAFGTQIEFGIARVEPGFRKWLRYWNQLRG